MGRPLLLSLVALLLAGCGGGPDASLLATAVRNTEAAGGAEVVMRVESTIPGLDEQLVMTGSGVQDAKERRGRIVLDMSQLAELPGMERVCDDGCAAETVNDGFVVYMRSPLFQAGLGDKDWMKLDLERFGSAIGVPIGNLGIGTQGPSDQLRMLQAVSGDLKEEGSEELRGTETTHYSATIELRRLPDTLPEGQRAAARRGMERLIRLTGQSETPMDVWIDEEERVRRLEMDQQQKQNGLEVKMHITIEYVRFGVPVEVDVPDDGDVFDATDLALERLKQDSP
jgi:hypothetical protein